MLILEESFEILDSSVRQQAMLCIVALRSRSHCDPTVTPDAGAFVSGGRKGQV